MTPLMAGFAGGFFLGLLIMALFIGVIAWLASLQWSPAIASVVRITTYSTIVLFGVLFGLRFFGIGTAIILLPPIAFFTMPLWVPRVVGGGLRSLTDAYTGGSESVEPKPFYARAIAFRKRGQAADSQAEIENQLERFPGDAQGLMMLADLHANEFNDVPAALVTLDLLLAGPGRSPEDLALALQQKASWELERLKDPQAARLSLERIDELCPGTQAALTARQQIARMKSQEELEEYETPRRLVVVHHPERVGLAESIPGPPSEDVLGASAGDGGEAARLVAHLEQFPDDWTAREELAVAYESKWKRPDLAADELERLILLTAPTPRQTTHWLNLLADLQLRSPQGAGAARLTLERVTKRFPGTVWSEQAESRIRLLGLDQRAKSAPRTIRLGTYEQNIGLKRGDPSIPDPAQSTR